MIYEVWMRRIYEDTGEMDVTISKIPEKIYDQIHNILITTEGQKKGYVII